MSSNKTRSNLSKAKEAFLHGKTNREPVSISRRRCKLSRFNEEEIRVKDKIGRARNRRAELAVIDLQ